jgi:hypothetical protein
MAVYNLCSLSLINGYNPFASYANVRNLDGVTMRLGLGKHFLFNVTFQVSLILLAWLVRLIYLHKARQLRQSGAGMTPVGLQQIMEVRRKGRRLSSCVFVLTAYAFFLFVFALLASLQPNN